MAVLPLRARGSDPSLAALAEGITEEIVTGLSRFTYLRVIAQGSTAKYTGESRDMRAIGQELGARYVMEGSLRQAGSTCRLAVQLVDAVSGANLWAETFDRAFRPDDIFALQDELVPRIVSTVADQHGVLVHGMSGLIRNKGDAELSSHEAVLSVFGFHERMTPQEHARVRANLERAVEHAPDDGDCWAMLATLCSDEHMFGFNLRPDPLGRAQVAARRAVELSPSSALASQALAQSLFFRKELQAFRPVAERTIALNPMDGATCTFMGLLLAMAGDWERGCAAADAAMKLNPHFPGWYWLPPAFHALHRGDDRAAADYAMRVNIPGYFWVPVITAAAFGHLGETEAAQKAVRELLAIRPGFGVTAREELAKWFLPDLVERFLDGLRKAGLDVATGDRPEVASRAPETAGRAALPAPAAAGHAPSTAASIAVLPFANMSADADQDYFSDGLAEEIINLLAHVKGLKVIARTSAFAFRGREEDVRGIADALGVRTILQGSVRRAGSRLRVTAQLINAADGGHLWSERYDRDLTDVFAIQDEIGRAISEALQVRLAPRTRAVNVEAYQCHLKGRHYLLRLTPENLTKAKECFEQALVIDPNYAPAYSGLAEYYHTLLILGIEPVAAMAPLARSAAEQALAIDADQSEAHSTLASMAASVDYQWDAADAHHRRALAVESAHSQGRFRCAAWYLLPLGRVAEAEEQIRAGLETDPLSMSLHYGMVLCTNAARRDRETIAHAERALDIDAGFYPLWITLGHAQLHLGMWAEAIRSLTRVVEIAPWLPAGVGSLAAAYHAAGDRERGREWARQLAERHGPCYGSALYHAVAGDADAVFVALDAAYRHRDVFLLFIQSVPFFDPYRSDPRFQTLLAKMNLV